MTNVLDGIGVTLDTVPDNKCPICEKGTHPTTEDKKENKGCLESKPQDLGCAPIPPNPAVPNFTTAAHHLVPANQCLKAFPRLSQMCDAVGYNVNNPQNGLSLPTVGQQEANVYDGKKYSKLKPEDKKNVAFAVMEGLNFQWHVGHHKWDTTGLNVETDSQTHVVNYDKLVKIELRDLERDIKDSGASICDPKKPEKGQEVIADMNALSAFIKGRVSAWMSYFVSRRAFEFKVKYRS